MTTDKYYSLDDISAALNRAADNIIEAAQLPDTGTRDAINLVVNAATHYLQHPQADLHDAIRANYELDADSYGPLNWIGG